MKKSLLLTPVALATIPMASCAFGINSVSQSNTVNLTMQDDQPEEEKGSCTFVYVGKDVSENGKPMLCRCMDMGSSCEVHLQVYERDELANQTFTGKNGFTWTLPEHTAKCVVAPVNRAANWGPYVDEMGINEYGVAMSETLTCATNTTAQTYDPFVKDGIAEETIGHVIIPAARTAREGVQLLIDTIAREDKGNAGAEAVFLADQKECWYVELYTGYQALGVKLPNNKMFVQGNEFGLHTLEEFSPSDIIATPGYDQVPFRSPATGPINLFDTYAAPLSDGSHRRTWRGLNLFGPKEYRENAYDTNIKYNWMFKPVHKPGMTDDVAEGVKLNLDDVIGIYRDGFDDILANESDPNHEAFEQAWEQRKLRFISANTTGQIHILSVDQNENVDPSMAAQVWLGLSPAKFTPFVPVNAAITGVSAPYSVVSPNADYNPNSMWWACRSLNNLGNLADVKDERTGDKKYPNFNSQDIIDVLNAYQTIWQQEYEQIYNHALTMNDVPRRNWFLTNYCTSVQNEAFKLVNDLAFDASQYYIKYNPQAAPTASQKFIPLIDLEEFVKKYGYAYNRNDTGARFTKGENTYTVVMHSGIVGETAKLRLNNTTIDNELQATYKGDKIYIDYSKALTLFQEGIIAPVDVNVYMPTSNILIWLLPTILAPVAAVAIILPIILHCRRKHNEGKTSHK